MGVPFLVTVFVTYTAGAVVLLPFQIAFALYDTAVFVKRAAKYTSKGFFYLKQQKYKLASQPKKVKMLPIVNGNDWVMMDEYSPDKQLIPTAQIIQTDPVTNTAVVML